jgi:hypothetical protein
LLLPIIFNGLNHLKVLAVHILLRSILFHPTHQVLLILLLQGQSADGI